MAESKVVTAREAVRRFVKPNIQIGMGGFGYTRRPFTIAREILRQQIGGLFICMYGGATLEEMLAAHGLIQFLDTAYLGLDGLQPVAVSVRRGIEKGSIKVVEDQSSYALAARALAGRYGWSFAPIQTGLGGDTVGLDAFGAAGLRGHKANGDWLHPSVPPRKNAVIDDPFEGFGLRPHAYPGGDSCANVTNALARARASRAYTGVEGVKVLLEPPLAPEVAIIRAQRVGDEGTVRMDGARGLDCELALAARHVVVECELVVPEDELRAAPDQNQIPAHRVSAIVEQPWGAFPTATPGFYNCDWQWWSDYSRINQGSEVEVKAWWWEQVGGTRDDWDYLYRSVGMGRLLGLRDRAG